MRLSATDRAVRVARFPLWVFGRLPARALSYEATSDRTRLRWRVWSPNAGSTWRADVNGRAWTKPGGSARWWRTAEAAMRACEERDAVHGTLHGSKRRT